MKSDEKRGKIKERDLLKTPKKALVQIILMQKRIIEEFYLSSARRPKP